MTRHERIRPPGGTPDELVAALRAALEPHPEVAFAYLYGSAARGRPHGLSDLDVGVHPSEEALEENGPGIGGRLWSELYGAVEEAVPGTRIDLVFLHRTPPLLSERIARPGRVVLSRDEPARLRWVVHTKSRYCDLRPLRRRLDDAVERRIRTGRFGRGDGHPEVVRRRLRRLDERLGRLRELAGRPREEFLEDSLAQAAAERLLQVSVQIVLDVGAHVLSERGILDWEEYRQIPELLAREGVIPPALAGRLADAAGQRNVLVHLYLDVDPELVHRTLLNDLDAFDEFAACLSALLEEEGAAED